MTNFMDDNLPDVLSEKQLDDVVITRSKIHYVRNLKRPRGELYAPVYFDKDCMIKLVKKPNWNGLLPVMVEWCMEVIDIDQDFKEPTITFQTLVDRINETGYGHELFYVHKTTNGFHLYLVSGEQGNTSEESVKMQIDLQSDPAHSTNTLYTGNSIRLCKKNKNEPFVSKFVGSIGTGLPDPVVLSMYRKVQSFLQQFERFCIQDHQSEILKLSQILLDDSLGKIGNFGYHHIRSCAPCILQGKQLVDNLPSLDDIDCTVYDDFVRSSKILDDALIDALLPRVKRTFSFGTLYRILESTDDYACGVHIQESLLFISYRDLLCLDYDHTGDLLYLKAYLRKKDRPKLKFRIVQTNKGYHCFLVSKPVQHDTPEARLLLTQLRSDPFHVLSSIIRGYSIRINKKYQSDTEVPYVELGTIGDEDIPDDPRLMLLYNKHLEYYRGNKFSVNFLYKEQQEISQRMYKIFTSVTNANKISTDPDTEIFESTSGQVSR